MYLTKIIINNKVRQVEETGKEVGGEEDHAVVVVVVVPVENVDNVDEEGENNQDKNNQNFFLFLILSCTIWTHVMHQQ